VIRQYSPGRQKSRDPSKSSIYAGLLDSKERKRILMASSMPVYAEPGYLLFHREGTLFAQTFDAKRLELAGEPIRVADEVAYNPDGRAAFAASQNGILVYRTGSSSGTDLQLEWVDRTGKSIGTIASPAPYLGLDLSPDGKRVAIHRHDTTGGDIWIFESDRGTMSRLTFDATQDNSSPIWSPDGARILFGSQRNGKWGLYTKPADGTGNDELLIESDVRKMPMAWSGDGKFVGYWVDDGKGGGGDLWILPLNGDRKPIPILQTPFPERHPQISSDGKWIAYTSGETGRSEIYIRPFPAGAGKWQVSTKGGNFSRWRRDGKELYFMNANSGGKMMAADIRVSGSSLQVGVPHELFDSGYTNFSHSGTYHAYAVSADGQRFLIPRPTAATADTAATPLTVVVNWTAALTKK
jgi:eukaryotic-like serine/threonine-protein kinase